MEKKVKLKSYLKKFKKELEKLEEEYYCMGCDDLEGQIYNLQDKIDELEDKIKNLKVKNRA